MIDWVWIHLLSLCRPLPPLSFNYTNPSGAFPPVGCSALMSPALISFQRVGEFHGELQHPRSLFVDSPCASVCFLSLDEVTMEEVGQAAQLRAGELIIIVVVLVMWAGNIPLQFFPLSQQKASDLVIVKGQTEWLTGSSLGLRCFQLSVRTCSVFLRRETGNILLGWSHISL